MLQRKAQEAQERGESVPNIDGMEVGPRRQLNSGVVCLGTVNTSCTCCAQEALADKELYKKKEQIAHQHEYLMNNAGTEKANPKGTT